MGIFFDYFTAPDDEAAGAVLDWSGGPARPPAEKSPTGEPGQGWPTIQDTGVEPTVALGKFQELLTGKTFDDQLADPTSRPLVASNDSGECVVVRIGDDLVTPLAEAAPERLEQLAHPWSEIEEFWGQGDPTHLQRFLTDLQSLAVQARDTGQGLYCWISL